MTRTVPLRGTNAAVAAAAGSAISSSTVTYWSVVNAAVACPAIARPSRCGAGIQRHPPQRRQPVALGVIQEPPGLLAAPDHDTGGHFAGLAPSVSPGLRPEQRAGTAYLAELHPCCRVDRNAGIVQRGPEHWMHPPDARVRPTPRGAACTPAGRSPLILPLVVMVMVMVMVMVVVMMMMMVNWRGRWRAGQDNDVARGRLRHGGAVGPLLVAGTAGRVLEQAVRP